MPYVYIVKEDDNNRGWFISHMVEDKLDNELSYPQFLSHLREQVNYIYIYIHKLDIII